jgi:hypothetical protein
MADAKEDVLPPGLGTAKKVNARDQEERDGVDKDTIMQDHPTHLVAVEDERLAPNVRTREQDDNGKRSGTPSASETSVRPTLSSPHSLPFFHAEQSRQRSALHKHSEDATKHRVQSTDVKTIQDSSLSAYQAKVDDDAQAGVSDAESESSLSLGLPEHDRSHAHREMNDGPKSDAFIRRDTFMTLMPPGLFMQRSQHIREEFNIFGSYYGESPTATERPLTLIVRDPLLQREVNHEPLLHWIHIKQPSLESSGISTLH